MEESDKSLQRIGMVAAGCIVAWALHFLTADVLYVQMPLMFLFVFLAVFFRNASYVWMTFFITLYVAFLFAILGEWTVAILEARLYETAIGCTVSLIASRLVGYGKGAATT